MTSGINIWSVYLTSLLLACCCESADGNKQQELDRSVMASSRQYFLKLVFYYDEEIQQKYGSNFETYLEFLKKRVAYLLTHQSLGQAFSIAFYENQPIPREDSRRLRSISHSIEKLLFSFEEWINVKRRDDQSTIAIYLSRKVNYDPNRSTIGMARVMDICSDKKTSVVMVADDGGDIACDLTIVHEIGHILGLEHVKNDIEAVMRSFSGHETHPVWSEQTVHTLQRMIGMGNFDCLLTPTPGMNYDKNRITSMYDVSFSKFFHGDTNQIFLSDGCRSVEQDECKKLSCNLPAGNMYTPLQIPMGYPCGDPSTQGCYKKQCVNMKNMKPVNGKWNKWSSFTACSKDCGGGIKIRYRNCTKPLPQYGGKYCVGDNEHYQTCNNEPCGYQQTSLRQELCNKMQYNVSGRGTSPEPFTELIAVTSNKIESSCRELNCKGVADDMVRSYHPFLIPNGEVCMEGSKNRDFKCLNGRCLKVGCNGYFDSMSSTSNLPALDKCGNCETGYDKCRSTSFEKTVATMDSKGQLIRDVQLDPIPAGAMNIIIIDLTPKLQPKDDPYISLYLGKLCLLNCGNHIDAGDIITRSSQVTVKYSGLKKSSRWIHIEDKLTEDLQISVRSFQPKYKKIKLYISYWKNGLPFRMTACGRKCRGRKNHLPVYPNGTEWSPTREYTEAIRLKEIDVQCKTPCRAK